ncbi:hypothetical protein J6590_005873 [Homalodisca vitripennis]|nr:hypothetical protein J6590_005873 [Homalodisca vitripennis]
MMKQSNIDMYQEAVTEVTNDFVHRILQVRNCSNETDKDFIGELRKWALEVLGVVALDHRFGCLQGTLSREAQEIMKAVENFHQVTYSLDTQPLPLWQYFSTSDFSIMVSALDYLHGVSEEYVAHAEQRLQTKEEIRSILEKLVGQGADGKDVAVVLAVDMFLAGVEIIAAMSATLLYALAKHPESQQWLFEHTSFRTRQQALPFLQAFIKETMRLWPVAIGTLRTPDKDLVLSGYRIPKGSLLLTSNYIMCRNPKYFKNPLHFRPERWLSSERLEYSQFAFAPFGIGVRSCVGRRIAMLELETFLLNIGGARGPCKHPLVMRSSGRETVLAEGGESDGRSECKIRLTVLADIPRAAACFRAERDGDCSIDALTAIMFSGVLTLFGCPTGFLGSADPVACTLNVSTTKPRCSPVHGMVTTKNGVFPPPNETTPTPLARARALRRLIETRESTLPHPIVNNFKIEYNYEDVKFESKFLNVISSPLQLTFIDRASI